MQLRFTLRQLEYLAAVGECGSIALAAEKVNVSSPSISAAISQLEEEFGLQLFVRRHAHGLALTQSGRRFLEQALVVLREAGRLHALANDLTGQIRGPLNIGCLLTFAQILLPQLRRDFAARHPEVATQQFERDQTELLDGLRGARLDVALTCDFGLPADLEFVPLVSLPPYAAMAVDHELAGRERVSLEELAAYPMVLLDLPLSAEYVLSFFTAAGLKPRIAERTRDMAVMRALVANGFGYSIANLRPLSDRAPDGKLMRFAPLAGGLRPMRLGVATTAGARLSPTARAFVEHCQEVVALEATLGLRSP